MTFVAIYCHQDWTVTAGVLELRIPVSNIDNEFVRSIVKMVVYNINPMS